MKTLFSERGMAQFSDCDLYRYLLVRNFTRGKGVMAAIGLNPSTATHEIDDPTIARLIKYAQRWGYLEFRMLNAFAYRSTDPENLYLQQDPVGAENDKVIKSSINSADLILCAWGTHAAHHGRHEALLRLLLDQCKRKIHCLKVNQDNSPGHPLYLKSNLDPVLYCPERELI